MYEQEEFDFDAREENLERVSSRIAAAVIRFCRGHREFHADELRQAVTRDTGITAPGSADRVLRDLRARGFIDYVVVNRRGSLYQMVRVGGEEAVWEAS